MSEPARLDSFRRYSLVALLIAPLAVAGGAPQSLAAEASAPAATPAPLAAPTPKPARAADGSTPADAGSTASPAAAADAPATDDAIVPEAFAIDEIVVSARRREESLEDVPVSVTVLSNDDLRASEVSRLDQIQQLVPSLVVARDQAGRPQFFLRGVGSPPGLLPGLAFDPGVGVYVDGVFLPRAAGQLLELVDVEQIEVLRGPQGTLYGKNTVGGAIKVDTVKPGKDLAAAAMLRPGNYGSLDTRAMLNFPVDFAGLGDRMFTRVAFGSSQRDGYVWNSYRDESLSDLDSLAFLGTLRFVPADDATIDLTGSWTKNHSKQRGGECVFRTAGAFGALVPPDPVTGETYFDACKASRPFDVQSDVASLIDSESWGTWLDTRAKIDLPGLVDGLAMRSLTAVQEQTLRARIDVDMTRFFLARQSEAGGAGIGNGGPRHQQQVSQELQVTGAALGGKLPFVAGVFAEWENGGLDADIWALPQVVNIRAKNRIDIDNWTWALFGQGTYELTSWLGLTGGLRYTQEKKGADVWWTSPFDNPAPLFADSESKVYDAWTPTASLAANAPESLLDGTPLQHALAYFTYARGFRGGGFDAVVTPTQPDAIDPVAPEHLDSFEVGFKTSSFDRRLTLNLALYQSLYDDLQVQTIVASTNAFDPRAVVLNAASAKLRGLELEALALPVQGLSIQGSVALFHGRFTDFESVSAATGDPINRAGQQMPYVPEVQTFLAIQYSHPISPGGPSWLDGWLTPRLEWYHQSDVIYVAPEVPQGTQPAYDLLNARLAYEFMDGRAEVALWAKNLTDEGYFDFAFNLLPAGTLTRYYQLPRTFGAELSYRL